MSDTDREHLVANIVGHASDHVTDEVQQRVVAYWSAVDADLGERVAAGLGVDPSKLNGAAERSWPPTPTRPDRPAALLPRRHRVPRPGGPPSVVGLSWSTAEVCRSTTARRR